MTPQEFDKHAEIYAALKEASDAAYEAFKQKESELMMVVLQNGSVPPRAQKSVRVLGEKYQGTVSKSHTVTISALAAMKLKLALMRKGMPGFFKKLLKTQFVYVLADGAGELIEQRLPADAPRNLRALYRRCLVIEANSPRLEVEARKEKAA